MMKFDSIRWRLVLSYVLLTVLIVGLVGVLTLTLLGEYVRTQANAQLQENASAIAQQAQPLMTPYVQVNDLQDLAGSLSFLGHVRVRILDSQARVIVDSGLPETSTSVVWMQASPNQLGGPSFFVPLSPHQRSNQDAPWLRSRSSGGSASIIVRIEEGPWGRHVVFEAASSGTGAAGGSGGAASSGAASGGGASGGSASSGAASSGAASSGGDSAPTQSAGSGNADTQLVATVRYPIGDKNSPVGYVQLDSPASSGQQILAAMRRALLFAGLGAAIIAVAAGLLVSRGLTAPILDLAKSASQMSDGDLTARAPERGAREISQLARQFNQMAESLQASFSALSAERDTLRRFIADASHELRTPVTALGTFIELLQGPAAQDEEAREEFFAESQAEVKRLEWVTANLLNLSRLDAGLAQLDRQPCDLGELGQAAAAPFLMKAQQKGIHLEVRLPDPPLQLSCDKMRMEMAIGNLLENALKFTPAGGQVILSSGRWAGKVQIQVEDTGDGILPEDLPYIFERFYRGHTSQEGSGLGLSIVQSILHAHGGEVRAERLERGSRFTMNLPEASPDEKS